MDSIELRAYGKINLSLDIIGKRDNGYHEVEMIMQQITLFDTIKITKKNLGITVKSDCDYIPDNHKNITYKIANDIFEIFNINTGIHIDIVKRIPVAAGLAGGSADAAAIIIGLNKIFNLKMSKDRMKEIAVKHGADIPFCIEGGAVIARGIGEELEVIKGLNNVWMVLCKPPISVSTQSVYHKLDINNIKNHPNTTLLLESLEKEEIKVVAREMYNVLEEITELMYPIINRIEKKMREYGAIGSMMSGSGPTVFGIFKNFKSAEAAFKNLKRNNKQVYLVKSRNKGEKNEQN